MVPTSRDPRLLSDTSKRAKLGEVQYYMVTLIVVIVVRLLGCGPISVCGIFSGPLVGCGGEVSI